MPFSLELSVIYSYSAFRTGRIISNEPNVLIIIASNGLNAVLLLEEDCSSVQKTLGFECQSVG